jgi:hypothetical protein
MCDFVEGLTLWSGAAIIANAKINGLERRREKGDAPGACDGERAGNLRAEAVRISASGRR